MRSGGGGRSSLGGDVHPEGVLGGCQRVSYRTSIIVVNPKKILDLSIFIRFPQ